MPIDKVALDESVILTFVQNHDFPILIEMVQVPYTEDEREEISAYLTDEKMVQLQEQYITRELSAQEPVTTSVAANPTKKVINTRAKQMDLSYALAEFIDNSIQSWESGEKEHDLEVKITFVSNFDQIIISDNAKGMTGLNLGNALSPGSSLWRSQEGATGRFGEGLKIGIAHIGSQVNIRTDTLVDENNLTRSIVEWGGERNDVCPDNDPGNCSHGGCYYNDENTYWHKEIVTTSIQTGLQSTTSITGTEIKISHLNDSIKNVIQNPMKYSDLLTELLRLYSTKMTMQNEGAGIKIILVNEIFDDGFVDRVDLFEFAGYELNSYDESVMAKSFYKLPGVLHPQKNRLRINYDDGDNLTVDVLTGIRKGDKNGVSIWANHRLMEWDSKNITQPQMGAGYNSYAYDRSDRNLLAYVHITCNNSSRIPWRGPMKKGLHATDENTNEGYLISKFISWSLFRFNKYRIKLSTQKLDARDAAVSVGKNLSDLMGVECDDFNEIEKLPIPENWDDFDIDGLDTRFNGLIKKHYQSDFIEADSLIVTLTNGDSNLKSKFRWKQNPEDLGKAMDLFGVRSSAASRQKISLGMALSMLAPSVFYDLEEAE